VSVRRFVLTFSMYSQNNEEAIILEALNGGEPAGRLLDIGAYDGKTFSNTLRLFELGWSGVCIEPSPSVFLGCMTLHAENPRVELINAAITVGGGLSDFYDSGGDAVSSVSEAHKVRWEVGSRVRFKKYTINTMSVAQLFTRVGYDFQFVNLDVEGLNLELFRALPFDLMATLRVLCVEHDGHAHEMMQRMAGLGFRLVGHNGENLIFTR
jgi:FkbM family methyltransferase